MRLGRAAGLTDTGRRRLRNEDAFVCEPPLFAVADGMGGARAGEIAARLAATALEEAAEGISGPEAVAKLISEANRRIWERSLADPETAGMGTTVTAALVDEKSGKVAIGHVGDSRAYLFRDGALEQLTADHSLVAELVESGLLTPEEAERHPQRSAITRALGTEPEVEVDAFTIDARPGDLFLLCSDGLPIMVGDSELRELVESVQRAPAEAAEALVAAANARGGQDNVTVVLFELVAGGESEPGTAVAADVESGDGSADVEPPTAVVAAPAEPATPATPVSEPPGGAPEDLSRHGAGPGGRLLALVLIVGIVSAAALLLYWGLLR
ncbi:MAG TPA: Stp1/IreP family PP2C-type Ser/Thr phosphatase [Gaiellaceae bacterium]|nr:Stp1/IreP family PP2C-type Ser/Thr phosphatase [Gaiellaceae bacterium]